MYGFCKGFELVQGGPVINGGTCQVDSEKISYCLIINNANLFKRHALKLFQEQHKRKSLKISISRDF